MASPAVTSFLDALRRSELLPSARLEEVTRDGAQFSDSRVLARHLLQRGWLTPFQANHLVQGRAADLVLGAYVLVERLGEGLRGQVYKAKHRRMKRVAAVKVVRKDLLADPAAVERFYLEIQAASQLDHPNVVHAYDAGPAGPTHFLAMEFVEGTDLGKLVQQSGPLPVEQAAAYVTQAALGLQHASERGLVHRDIKPSNLIVTGVRGAAPGAKTQGSGVRSQESGDLYTWGLVKILDFGLARLLARAGGDSGRLKHEGAPEYLAPEQTADNQTVDTRADIYSLGCTLYFLLTGKTPAGPNAPPVEKLRPQVSAELAETVRYMMAPLPKDRIQTPQEVAVVLAGLFGFSLSGPVSFSVQTVDETDMSTSELDLSDDTSLKAPVPDPEAHAQERRLLVIAGMGLVIGLLGLTIFLLYSRGSGEISSEAPKPGRTAEADLRALVAAAKEKPADAGELWQGFYDLTARYPGTPEARQARDWLFRVASPCDALNAAKIPGEERYPTWQPKELVSVLGEHRWRGWGVTERCVACSPSAPVMASGDNTGAYLWDATSGRLLFHLRANANVHGVSFAPDGQTLLTAGSDKTVKHWQVSTGQLLATIPGHAEQVLSVAFAPDGQSFATGSIDKTVRVWDLATRKERAQFKDHKATVSAVAYSPDGQLLASASHDGTTRLWDLKTKAVKHVLAVPGKALQAVAFSPGGEVLATGGSDHAVRLWDVESGQELNQLKKHTATVMALAFTADGLTLASGAHDTQVRFWDMTSRQERPTSFKGPGTVAGVAFTRDGKTVAAATSTVLLRLGDPATGQPAWTPRGHTHLVRGVAIAPDCRTIVTSSWDGTVKLWDPAGNERLSLTGITSGVDAVAIAPDGQTLAAVGRHDKLVRFWDTATGKNKRELKGHELGLLCVAFSPDGKLLASGGIDKTVRLWDLAAGKEQQVLPGALDTVNCLAFSPDGGTVAWSGQDKVVRLWDVVAGKSKGEFKGPTQPVHVLAFSPDGTQLAVGSDDRTVRFWEVATGKEKGHLDAQTAVHGLTYSADGQWLVATGSDGRCGVWKVNGRTRVKDWLLPGAVYDVAAAADGRHIVTANGNGTSYVIRLAPLTVRNE